MPNALRSGLADLGRASPALSRTWSDIMGENRARRQEAVQGEEMALRREKFQQEKAISDVTLQKEQMALEAQKKKEAWLDEPMDITTHPTFMGLSQETQNKVKQDFSTQKVTDSSGRGTRRNILGHIDMMEKTPKILDSYLTVEMNTRHDDVLKANEDLQKELQKPDADPQKVSKLQAAFDATNQKYTGLMKNHKDYMEAMGWKASIDATAGEIKRLQSEGKLGEMPEALKQSMFMALRTGDLKTVNDVLKEWAKSEFKPASEPKKWPQTKEEVQEEINMKAKAERQTQKPSDFDKKWVKAEQMAKEKFGSKPTITQVAGIFKEKFGGAVNFLNALFGEGGEEGKPSEELVYDPKTGTFIKKGK